MISLTEIPLANTIPLDAKTIKALLGREERITPPQVGPIKRYDETMRCASRGCSAPTYLRLRGVPRCVPHIIRLANELMVEHGIT